ncbi:MAG: hypothetical protein M1840_004154 [Geoglossum simile]|nr:MAG: hypothetical protein M1840_004154 [Geoglossum simile]
MAAPRNIVESAIEGGILSWSDVGPRVEKMLEQVAGRATLFVGSALSSFKPAMLPVWDIFIQLLYVSLVNKAAEGLDNEQGVREILRNAIQEATKSKILQNYEVTETIARRQGTEYLDLLRAFSAQKQDGIWAANGAHRWVARSLREGKVAAVITTNFDDYIERALESLLSMAPQLGGGKMTFLFKIHGSCYEPETCIDTRLQRSQGLPSYTVDILDTLLQRTLWFVTAFSGGDMNDNADYLRIVSNKSHARVVWLHYPGSYKEKGLRLIQDVLDTAPESPQGLCVLEGVIHGERVSEGDDFPPFRITVEDWAGGLGPEWCKLTVIDLIRVIQARGGAKLCGKSLKELNFGESPRQDWNQVLQRMDKGVHEKQAGIAQKCCEVAKLIEKITDYNGPLSSLDADKFCEELNDAQSAFHQLQVWLQETVTADRPHAQSWVISALYGLILYCGGCLESALEQLRFSSAAAWLVGDIDTYRLLIETINSLPKPTTTTTTTTTPTTKVPRTREGVESEDLIEEESSTYMAFIPAMDNPNSKLNRYGVPPAQYMRALLHRAILFSDYVALPLNVLTNSSVFINEILFNYTLDTPNEFYLQYIVPILPDTLEFTPGTLWTYRQETIKRSGYLVEPVDERQIKKLDDYFQGLGGNRRFLNYDAKKISRDYGEFVRRQVEPEYQERTVEHLVKVWENLENPSDDGYDNSPRDSPDRQLEARDAAQFLVRTLHMYFTYLPPTQPIYRSNLYRYTDLFTESSDDPSTILPTSLPPSSLAPLLSRRAQIVKKPWIYGPFCHELFDPVYVSNIAMDLAMREIGGRGYCWAFVEERELWSWEFVAEVRGKDGVKIRADRMGIPYHSEGGAESHYQISSLLLGQMSQSSLLTARNSLLPIRKKLRLNTLLDEADGKLISQVMREFTQIPSSAKVGERIEKVRRMEERERDRVRELVRRCVFLVRKGRALERMYEEPYLAVPGMLGVRCEV